MFKELWLTTWKDYEIPQSVEKILPVNKLNLFIGKNNSGKSRLLRALAKADESHFECKIQEDNFENYLNDFKSCTRFFTENDPHMSTLSLFKHKIKNNIGFQTAKDRAALNDLVMHLKGIFNAYNHQRSTSGPQQFTGNIARASSYHIEHNAFPFSKFNNGVPNTNVIYIPILRGMRPLSSNSSVYSSRTINDYKIPEERIHTGEEFYSELKKHLLGMPEQREKIRVYEELLSRNFFEGKNVTLIPKHDQDVLNIKVGDEDQYPIYELGDGLQQIVIITSAAYLANVESIVCIEEPENFLHPGYARQLMLFLLNETPHQYFVSTHSNHLLELADERNDTNIHKVNKINSGREPKFNITTINKDRSLLLDLGVKSSSVYISNCTIWVEGITDRLYIKEYMAKYIKELRVQNSGATDNLVKYIENYHYAFVEYQGGNLTHWSFLDDETVLIDELKAVNTTSPIFLIADGDISNKADRTSKLEQELGSSFYLLKGKEIENLIPEVILKSCAKTLYKSFKRNTYNTDINRISTLKYDDYSESAKGVGEHLDKTIRKPKKFNKSELVFAENSGTVRDKRKLCDLAISYMQNNPDGWELTPQIIHLCKAIFKHVKDNN